MARPLRIEFEGAIYHVTFRGNERRNIFRGDRDRRAFLERLAERVKTYGIRLYLYCLMTNHVHLLVETPGANLSAFMGSLLTSYTNYFNARHRRAGHLTQGRFKSPLVEGDEYLLRLSRYIHLNPVFMASVVKNQTLNERIRYLRAHPWSSYRSYVGVAAAPSWISCQPVLAMMGERNVRKQYAKFVEAGIAKTDDDFVKLVGGCGLGLGSETFMDKLKALQVTAGERYGKEDRAFRRMKSGYEPTRILQDVARYYGCEPGDLKLRRKGDWAKPVAAELLIRHSGLTQRKVANLLGLSTGAAVCMQIKRVRSKEGTAARIAVGEIERLF